MILAQHWGLSRADVVQWSDCTRIIVGHHWSNYWPVLDWVYDIGTTSCTSFTCTRRKGIDTVKERPWDQFGTMQEWVSNIGTTSCTSMSHLTGIMLELNQYRDVTNMGPVWDGVWPSLRLGLYHTYELVPTLVGISRPCWDSNGTTLGQVLNVFVVLGHTCVQVCPNIGCQLCP